MGRVSRKARRRAEGALTVHGARLVTPHHTEKIAGLVRRFISAVAKTSLVVVIMVIGIVVIVIVKVRAVEALGRYAVVIRNTKRGITDNCVAVHGFFFLLQIIEKKTI